MYKAEEKRTYYSLVELQQCAHLGAQSFEALFSSPVTVCWRIGEKLDSPEARGRRTVVVREPVIMRKRTVTGRRKSCRDAHLIRIVRRKVGSVCVGVVVIRRSRMGGKEM